MFKNYQILNYVNTNKNEMLLINNKALIDYVANQCQRQRHEPKKSPFIIEQQSQKFLVNVVINQHNKPMESFVSNTNDILYEIKKNHQEFLQDQKLMNYLNLILGVDDEHDNQHPTDYYNPQLNLTDIIKFVTQTN